MYKLILSIVVILIVISVLKTLESKLISKKEKPFQKFPYKRRNFLTQNELSYFKKIEDEYKDKYYIIPQVSISSIVDVDLPKNFYAYKGYRSKIDKKTIDFVLFNKETFQPEIAIELDDSSHFRKDRQERDEFVNKLFEQVGIRLERV